MSIRQLTGRKPFLDRLPLLPTQTLPRRGQTSPATLRSMIQNHFATAPGPLRLKSLAQEVRAQMGPVVDETGWFGAGGLFELWNGSSFPTSGCRNTGSGTQVGTMRHPTVRPLPFCSH